MIPRVAGNPAMIPRVAGNLAMIPRVAGNLAMILQVAGNLEISHAFADDDTADAAGAHSFGPAR